MNRVAVLFAVMVAIHSFPLLSDDEYYPPSHGLSIYGFEDLKMKPGESYPYANLDAPKQGHLHLAAPGTQFTKLITYTLKGVSDYYMGTLMIETPMDDSYRDDEPFAQYGLLVQSVELAKDHMSLIYNINPKARFSDGRPVTAEDFVFSFDILADNGYSPYHRTYFSEIKSCEALDTHRVKFTYKNYNQELPLSTGHLPIFPKHVYGAPGKRFGEDFDEVPLVASGPYVVEKYEFGKFITYKKNPDWWGKDLAINRGRFNYDRITFHYYADLGTRQKAILAGKYDARLVNSSYEWAQQYDGPNISEKKYITKRYLESNRVQGMQGFFFNMRSNDDGRVNPLQSKRVRTAIAMVFDFDWANQELFYGQYERCYCYFDVNKELMSRGAPEGRVLELLQEMRTKHGRVHVPNEALAFIAPPPGAGMDPDMQLRLASLLLEEGGWKMAADGVRAKGSARLEFNMPLVGEGFVRIVGPFAQRLAQIGVKLNFRAYQTAIFRQIKDDFQYDMILGNIGVSLSPGNEQRGYWGSESANVKGTRNLTGIENPAVDELIDKLCAATNREELVNCVKAMDRILVSKMLCVPNWTMVRQRVLYWEKLNFPEPIASRYGFENYLLEWSWEDSQKKAALEQAMAAGEALRP